MNSDDEDPPFPEPVEIPIGESIDLHYFRPSETASVVDKAPLRQDSGIASRLLAAAKQVKVRLTFSPGNVS